MDWATIFTALLTSVGGTGTLLLIIAFLWKKWLSVRIEESIKHEYARKLEEHKAGVQAGIQEAQAEKVTDRALFQEFLKTLPTEGSIAYIQHANMKGYSFAWKALEQLQEFRLKWDNPEHEFLDPDLEEKRRHLLQDVNLYLQQLSLNTYPVNNDASRAWVPADWEDTQNERFSQIVDELHGSAERIVRRHSELVRCARSRLRC